MQTTAHLYSIRPGTHVPSLAFFGKPGRVRRPLLKSHWPKSSDVARRDVISIRFVATGDTSEAPLCGTIGTGCMATLGTGLGRATWVTEHDLYASPLRLILDFRGQVPESPGGHHAVEPLATTRPIADAIQSFQHNDGVGILQSSVNDTAAQLVVDVLHPTPFLAFASLDSIHATMPTVAVAQVGKVFPLLTGLLAVEEQHFVGHSNDSVPHDTQVNANERRFAVTDGWRAGNAERQHHIPVIATLEQFGIAIGKGHLVTVSSRDTQGQPDISTTLASRNTEHETVVSSNDLVGVDTQADALHSVDRRERCPMAALAQTIVGAHHCHSGVDSHACIVSRQREGAGLRIHRFMQVVATTNMPRLCHIKAILHSLRESVGHILKPQSLILRRRQYLDDDRFFTMHKHSIAQMLHHVKWAKADKSGRFLPGLKPLSFRA